MEAEPLATNYVTRRDRKREGSPTVSVVIASSESEDTLESCISALRTRFDPSHTEYVVAWPGTVHTAAGADLKRRFPYVHFVSANESSSPADLRMQGMKAATGDVVLLLQNEDASADAPAVVNPVDAVHGRGSWPKWLERPTLRGSRESEIVASNG